MGLPPKIWPVYLNVILPKIKQTCWYELVTPTCHQGRLLEVLESSFLTLVKFMAKQKELAIFLVQLYLNIILLIKYFSKHSDKQDS